VVEPKDLIDGLVDFGLDLSPATDWSLTIPEEWLPLLPLDGDRLTRQDDRGRAGYFRSPVCRGIEVVPQPAVPWRRCLPDRPR
jgi:hypothetical protein